MEKLVRHYDAEELLKKQLHAKEQRATTELAHTTPIVATLRL